MGGAVSDERKDWSLIADAREWLRIVESDPAWRKVYIVGGPKYVGRLSNALEAALEREAGEDGGRGGRLRPVVYATESSATVEYRGEGAWAVCNAGLVLAYDGTWEYEPRPSNRSDEFKARTRYGSANEALAALEAEETNEPHENGGAMIPRGNIIPETYREYVEWREQRDLVDGSELRRRIEGQIALRGYWMVCWRLDSRWSTHAIEIRTLKRVLRMLDELEREGQHE